jgi:hypothetical protein
MSDTQPNPAAQHEGLWKQVGFAIKANFIPGLILWAVGLTIVLSYYFYAPVTEKMDQFGKLVEGWGYAYALLATPIFGAVLPFAMQFLVKTSDGSSRQPLSVLPFNVAFWAYRGVEIALLYKMQDWVFRNVHRGISVPVRGVIDQFFFVPIWAVPTMVLMYLWRDNGFSYKRLGAVLERNWYSQRVMPIMIANWVIWVPGVMLIYALPQVLQTPMMNLILCLFVMIFTVMVHHHKPVSRSA